MTVRKVGRNYVARCPSCADSGHDRSGDNLAILIEDPRFYKCWAGCTKEMIRAALGCPIRVRILPKKKESVAVMKQKRLSDEVGLRLSRQALRVLKERGIFAHSPVSLEHQHLAKRYVVRGLESGGAVGDLGRYVTFAREDGQAIECLHPVEAIGVNGLHAVVVAPVLVRIEMLRKERTYELLITRHRPGERKRRQATSTGDESPVSWHSWASGVGSVRQRQKPSRCRIADVLFARR